MKYILILLFFFSAISFSQTKLDLKFYDTCLDSVVRLEYSLYSSKEFDPIMVNKSDSIATVKQGKYLLVAYITGNEYEYKDLIFEDYLIRENRQNDTIVIPRILRKFRNTGLRLHGDLFLGYFNCDEICNGYIADYYRNGSIRLEGFFEDGIPKDWIRKYDVNEKLTEMIIYDKKGNLKKIKTFD